MLAALAAYNFPPKFCSYIKLMYTDIGVYINYGGGLTARIPFEKGVKQGDPMASALFILCIEPMLRRVHRRMLEIAPGPFPGSPGTNLSVYADDTVPLVSHPEQFTVIDEELATYGRFSGGRVKISKCEVCPLGSWRSRDIRSRFKVVEGTKILGLYFGTNYDANWSILMIKFKSKLEHYKKSNATSLFSKALILNTFVLPVLWYGLKVLEPPVSFLSEIERLCLEYIWGGKKWVRKQFVFAPTENGGLGVRHPRVQTLSFRMRMIQKVIGPSPSEYFLSTVKRSCESLIFSTLSPTPFYNSVAEAALTMRVELSGYPEGY